jgi:hypothetical protein
MNRWGTRARGTCSKPGWGRKVWYWLTDGQYERLFRLDYDPPEWHYTWRGWVEEAGKKALCTTFGHEPVADQCNRPEHDLCTWCHKLMPNRAKRP